MFTGLIKRIVAISCICWSAHSASAQEAIDFNQQIRPILSKHCLACHGSDEGDRQAGLRLDTHEGATEAAIEPGDPDGSDLIDRITTDDEDLRMPPADHASALNDEEIELLRQWIADGAEYKVHWSFAPIEDPAIPNEELFKSKEEIVVHNSIDKFILEKVTQADLSQSPPSKPSALVRRASLDLTGLPPSVHDDEVQTSIDSFLEDPTQTNYEVVVDQLLKTPGYAEHWASMWLDVARYADTCGYAGDETREIWPWRDWLIRAIGSDKNYQEFSTEMLAGDLLPNATLEQKLATAFHRNTLSNNEGGTNDEEFRTIAVKDRLSTTLNAWMGLTVRCAECHSHKYDPISHVEYYQLLDFFNQTVDADKNDDRPKLAVRLEADPVEVAKWDLQIEKLKKELVDHSVTDVDGSDAKDDKEELEQLQRDIDALIAKRDAPVRVPVMEERTVDQRRETFVNLRGNFQSKGEKVTAQFPEAFQTDNKFPMNRLGLAQWMFADDNPLTARVAVNRYWARLMGIGLVETEEDFGTQGTLPSHPELLDHLATEFRDGGWDVRALLKKIATSATYQQSQNVDPQTLEVDPNNRLLARGPRIRLTAEVVRDQALAVSGLLSKKMFGKPVYPPSPVKRVVNAFTGGMTWQESEGEDRYRRAIYTFLKRSSPHPLFETFDMSSRDVCSMRRLRTNTPLQSFMTLNDITFIEAARALAEKMLSSNDGEEFENEELLIATQINWGIRRAFYDDADENQTKVLSKLFRNNVAKFETDILGAAELTGRDTKDFDVEKISDEEKATIVQHASMTVVANVILNLDTFLNN